MKTHEFQINKNMLALIVEFEEKEIELLENGEPITVNLQTTFYNGNKLNEEVSKLRLELEKEFEIK